MKISKSKQELARIISENGGWCEGANFYAQDGCGEVWSYIAKPSYRTDIYGFTGDEIDIEFRYETVKNWHQTILSRDEYFHLYPATDDGWIEWRGGECPVDKGTLIDVRYRDGHEQVGCECGVWRAELYGTHYWLNSGGNSNIIAYRLHKPEITPDQQEPKPAPVPEVKSTIEQLAADYRSKLEIAQRAREEADAANRGAEAALENLVAAGKELGLALGVAAPEHELVITDWRDLRVGDEVECLGINITGDDYADNRIGSTGLVVATEEPGRSGQAVKIQFEDGDSYWVTKWRFIRRP